jgi:hypothetical protein
MSAQMSLASHMQNANIYLRHREARPDEDDELEISDIG